MQDVWFTSANATNGQHLLTLRLMVLLQSIWSGFAGQITDVTSTVSAQDSAPSASAAGEIWLDTNDSDSFYVSSGTGTGNWHHTVDEGTTSTSNFIRNRLTQL